MDSLFPEFSILYLSTEMPSDAPAQQFGRVVCIHIDFRSTAVIHHAIYEADGIDDNMSVIKRAVYNGHNTAPDAAN